MTIRSSMRVKPRGANEVWEIVFIRRRYSDATIGSLPRRCYRTIMTQ
jgi:hypothetical protein